MAKTLTRQLFELRFAPTHTFFDHRSQLLDVLYWDKSTHKKNFEHWQLTDNRVDVFDADRDRSFFVSFQNCGFTSENPPTDNYARDQIVKYVKLAFGVLGEYVEEYRRIGFRDVRVLPVRDFEKLTDEMLQRFIRVGDQLFATLDAPVVDLQLFPMIFRHGKNTFQITTGPVKRDQLAKQLWGEDPELPDQALWVDVDYYAVKPPVNDSIDRFVGDFVRKAQEIQARVLEQMSALCRDE